MRAWHAVVQSGDPALLDDLLADDVVFRSPAVFKPQEGKAVTTRYLTSAMAVLGPSLRYVGEWHGETSAVLEFEADLDGVYVQGVDMLRWNGDGQAGRLHRDGAADARAEQAGRADGAGTGPRRLRRQFLDHEAYPFRAE